MIDDYNAEYKVREMGDRILDEFYEDGEISSWKAGITILGCIIPLDVDIKDLYHDLYHLYKSLHGYRKKWKCRCTLQEILQSYMGYTLHPTMNHINHVFDSRFVKYVIKLVDQTKCSLRDLWDVVIRRSLQHSMGTETLTECTINALGWIDNETYWFLCRNSYIGLDKCEKSLGIILPYGDRYDTYIMKSYIGSVIYDKSPIHRQNYLKVKPIVGTPDIIEMKMKDVAILKKYGMLPRYNCKQDMINLLRDIQYNRMYEIHNKEKYYGRETSINMDVVDSNTRELFLIDNNLYTLEELVESCNNGMKFGIYPICRELAQDLLYFMNHYQELDCCDIISKYLEDFRDSIVSMKHQVSNDIIFKKFLMYLIEAGLYARRWKGHGYPYPYSSSDTDITGNTLYLRRLNNTNIKIMNIVNSMEFSWYRDNIILHKSGGSMRKKFIPYYRGMIEGNECIRLISEALIYTGYYYLRVIYGLEYSDELGNILDTSRLEFMNPISPEERTV